MAGMRAASILSVGLVASGCASNGTPGSLPSTSRSIAAAGQMQTPATFDGKAPPRLAGESVSRYLERVAEKVADGEVDAHIDADVTGQERSVIRSVMLSEPAYARANVVYVDRAGRIFSNHRAMAEATQILRSVPGRPGIVSDKSGRTFALPPSTRKPTFREAAQVRTPLYGSPDSQPHSGPYRRVFSDPEQWYGGGMHAVFSNPATNSRSVGPYNDVGYIYSGGWSNSGNDSADAGLQYSAARNVADTYLLVQSVGFPLTSNYREFGPNTDVEVDFIIGDGGCTSNCQFNSANLTAFNFGNWTTGGFGGVTIAVQPRNISDWTAYGTVLKDMITIGQSNPPNGIAYDGYSFGYIAVDYCGWNGPTFNVCLGGSGSDYHYYGQQVPNSNVVQVTAGSGNYNEDVGIHL